MPKPVDSAIKALKGQEEEGYSRRELREKPQLAHGVYAKGGGEAEDTRDQIGYFRFR
jgi:hypothetical protein